ncbi:hypothetical protein M8C21_014472, partial [Ambrosia artemisiifolia]
VNNAGITGMRFVADKIVCNAKGEARLDLLVDENRNPLPGVIEQTYEMAEECLKTNYYGTKGVTEALVPLLQLSKSPRIVNLTSISGLLSRIPNEKLKEELDDIDNLTEERIDEIIHDVLQDFKAGKLRDNGWPLEATAYKISKATINAYTRLMAKKFQNRIIVNCVHPGVVKTDMTLNSGIDVEEGAKGPVMATLLPVDGPSGVYFDQTKIAPFK